MFHAVLDIECLMMLKAGPRILTIVIYRMSIRAREVAGSLKYPFLRDFIPIGVHYKWNDEIERAAQVK